MLSTPDAFLASVGALEEPAGFLVAAVAAAVAAVMCRVTFSWRTAVGALVPALLAVVAPVATGHVASVGGGHDIATDAAVLAAVALATWLGTAVALARHRALARPDGDVVARRARWVALVAAPVALAGLVVVDVWLVRDGWATLYGGLAVAALVLVAARRRAAGGTPPARGMDRHRAGPRAPSSRAWRRAGCPRACCARPPRRRPCSASTCPARRTSSGCSVPAG